MCRDTGFTLVELVVVMVVLAILSIASVRFIGDSASGFTDTVTRDRLASTARFAMAELNAAVKDALPGSPRSNGQCLEVIPIVAASEYRFIPTAAAMAGFTAVPPPAISAGNVSGMSGLRVAVAPLKDIYQLSSRSVVSSEVVVSAADADNEVRVTFTTPHQFVNESPANRFYLVSTPLSYCFVGRRLWRYSNYGFSASQPAAADLPVGLPDRTLVAEDLAATGNSFISHTPDLMRNALVEISLALHSRDTELLLHGAAQVHNVP